MTTPLPYVAVGEPIRADDENARIARINALGRITAAGPLAVGTGSAATALALPAPARLGLWELTEPMHIDEPSGVPAAAARAVWLRRGGTPGSGPTYAASDARRARLFHPTGLPGTWGGPSPPTAIPRFTLGDWVYAWWNPQSGRWEILAPAEDLWRFELKTPLVPHALPEVPATAEAYLVVFDASLGGYVRTPAEFVVADFLNVWTAAPGCRGYARRMADSHPSVGWEVLFIETALPACGEPPSSGEDPEVSSSGEPPGSEMLDVLVAAPFRSGDDIGLPVRRLHFTGGCLVAIEPRETIYVYLCCDHSSSGEPAIDEPSSSGDFDDPLPSSSAEDPYIELPSSSADDPYGELPSSSVWEPGVEPPSSSAEDPSVELPSSSADDPDVEPPSSSLEDPDMELPSSSAEDPYVEPPSSSADDPDVELPSSSLEDPDMELPSSSAEDPHVELPSSSADDPGAELPSSSAEDPYVELPSSSAEDPYVELPSSSADDPYVELSSSTEDPYVEPPSSSGCGVGGFAAGEPDALPEEYRVTLDGLTATAETECYAGLEGVYRAHRVGRQTVRGLGEAALWQSPEVGDPCGRGGGPYYLFVALVETAPRRLRVSIGKEPADTSYLCLTIES